VILLPLVPSSAGGAPQRQDLLSPAGSMADGGGHGDPLVSRCLVSGGMGLPLPEADRRWTIATPVQAPRMRVPAGSGLCSSPCPRASIRLGLAPRRAPPRAVLTRRRPRRVLALISGEYSLPTSPRGAVGLCHHRHGSLRGGALVVRPQVHGVRRVPRRASTAPGPPVSVPRPSGPVGDPLSVLGRGGGCQTRHGSLQVGALVALPQAHGVPGSARVSSGETPWPRSFGLKSPDRWLRC